MSRTKRVIWGLGIFAATVVAARVAAPYLLLDYVNRTVDDLDGYAGEVDDIELDLWRGAYRIVGTRIVRTDSEVDDPFILIPRADISVQWEALFDGAIVAEVELFKPEMHFVATRDDATLTQAVESENWQDQVMRLTPLRINRVRFHDGQVHFRNPHRKPKVDLYLANANVRIENLTNSKHLSDSMQATLHATASAMGSGRLRIDGRIDPLAQKPTFDMKVKMEGLALTELNDFTRAYANVDVERGKLSVYSELEAKEGKLSGYVKPFVDHLKVLRWSEEDENFFGKLWELMVGGAVEMFEHQRDDSSATRIPLSGKIDSPKVNVWLTLVNLVRHALLGALDRSLANGSS